MNLPPDRLAALSPEKRALLAQRLAQPPAAPAPPGLERIAIVAVACRLPGGADSPDAFWQLLAQGRDAVTEVPAARWDGAALFSDDPQAPNRIHSRCGGFLEGLDRFDAGFFGIAPREAALMDPQQRLLLELAWEALEAAGLPVERLAGSATGVFVGAHSQSSDWWLLQLAQQGGLASHASTGSAHSILANRISYSFDLRGPSMAVDTACSSSLVAVHLACQSLRSGECELALAGGVNLMLLPSASFAFSQLQILAAGGRCRSFDAAADGIVRGEGCALVVLKRLSDAQRDGDPVLALIAGSAVNQDGASNGLTAPNGPAQEAVIRRALALAGIAPQRVGLVETHGTGTPLGDPVEVEALARVIGPPRDAAQRCFLGAVKTNIGHLEGAAGIAGLVKAVECLRRGQVPANLHFTRPNPHLQLEGTPFVLPTALTPWPAGPLPRVASVSSFGFGGTNAHVVLEEHVAPPAAAPAAPRADLFTVSARSRAALAQALRESAGALARLPEATLADALHTATVRRSHHAWRVAVSGATPAALAQRLEARLAALPDAPAADANRQLVWVFTGQGGAWPGMARELDATEPVFRAALDAVCARFDPLAGWPLRPVLTDPAEAARLAATDVAQPALFALQVALAAWWRAQGVAPGAVVGHSVGEVAAAHVAGVLTLDEAVRVVLQRSRPMHAAAGQGRMAQVECAAADLHAVLEASGGALAIAALNGPASTVIAGAPQALAAGLAQLAARGIVARELPVDYAFHSPQMQAFVPGIVGALAGLQPRAAQLPIVSTVSGRWAEAGDYGASYWGRNVREPVRFAPAVAQLIGSGLHGFLEIGPHPALGAGIAAVADSLGAPVAIAASLRREQPARATLLASLGQLYEAGAAIDWSARREPARRVLPLPPYPWQRASHWLAAPDPAALAFSVTGRAWPGAARADATACFEMSWPQAATAQPAPAFALEGLAAPLQALAAGWPEAPALDGEAPLQAALEQRAAGHAWQALRSLGVGRDAGARLGADSAAACGVEARHARLWQRLLELAATGGFLARSGDAWAVTSTGAAWHGNAAPVADRAEAALLERCGRGLAEVLRGRLDPLTLLFPPDGRDSAAQVYGTAPSARLYNRLAAEAVGALARSAARPLRVLEIGAGTGATSTALLAALPSGSRYCFTDVSPLFLHEAEARLRDAPVETSFRRLDIEQAPAAQGFEPGGFDLVVAANVLHATADLRRTLAHARSLLAPGGVLLLIETVARRAWADLSFGLTEGWWRFSDAPLRRDDALLGVDDWLALLASAGFDAVQPVGAALSRRAIHPQALLLARAAPAEGVPGRFAGAAWCVVADRGGFGARLAAAIRAEGGVCECVPADPPGPLDLASLAGVVDCSALDAATAGAAGFASTLRRAQQVSAGGAARLWLVTRGAQRVLGADRLDAPHAALAWGLGRSLALEHPAHWGGLVDLDPAAADAASLAGLLDTLAAGDGEDQVALRAGARHVARLAGRAMPAPAPLALDPAGACLVTGAFGGLGPKAAAWLADQGARTLVLIGRRGAPAEADDAALWAALRQWRERGIEVLTDAVDVADRVAMGRLFERLRAMGHPVRAVVHAAAAIRFQALHDLGPDDLAAALRAKVDGSRVLHELTRDTPLDLFVLFSSGTALFGAKGLAAYAAANQYLGALAWQRAALGLPATCVDWGAWSEIRLLGQERSGEVAQLGFRPMPDATAFDVLAGLVHERVPQCMVADVDWAVAGAAYQAHGRRPFLERLVPPAAAAAANAADADAAPAPAADLRGELAALAPRARRERLVALLRAELARVLGLAGPQAVDPAQGFFETGLDSLMAMQLRRRLAALLDLALSPTVTFNHPSAAQLADHLLALLGGPDGPDDPAEAAAVPAARPDTIAELSDDEVRRALMAELAGFDDDLAAAAREQP